jgi:hypothetical protein
VPYELEKDGIAGIKLKPVERRQRLPVHEAGRLQRL